MTKDRVIFIGILVALVAFFGFFIYVNWHPNYDEGFILGNSYENVVAKYGEFD